MAQQTLTPLAVIDSIQTKSTVYPADTDLELKKRESIESESIDAVQYIDNSKILATQKAEDILRSLYNNKRILKAKMHIAQMANQHINLNIQKTLNSLDAIIKLSWTVDRNVLKHTTEDTFTKALIVPSMDGVINDEIDHTKLKSNNSDQMEQMDYDNMFAVRAAKKNSNEARYLDYINLRRNGPTKI